MKTIKKPFFSDCVGWPREKVDLLHELVDEAQDIARSTFLAYADSETMRDMEVSLGYGKGFPMSKDWHVSYHVHRPTGIKYFKHSAIEYVFADKEQMVSLERLVEQKQALLDLEDQLPHVEAVCLPADLVRLAFVNQWSDDFIRLIDERTKHLNLADNERDEFFGAIAQDLQLYALRGEDPASLVSIANLLNLPSVDNLQEFLDENRSLCERFDLPVATPGNARGSLRVIGSSMTEVVLAVNDTSAVVVDRAKVSPFATRYDEKVSISFSSLGGVASVKPLVPTPQSKASMSM
ncbi:hypothetical protein CL689_07100 [Candidatus Saccharibacteria bacterium]|nr:hypothetical protein [Candidatus Saccharibacteria bacterium]|tara:strand:- start:246 stop:1124 length:879 start_codon:yes stop_codon:yes gene_type:complete